MATPCKQTSYETQNHHITGNRPEQVFTQVKAKETCRAICQYRNVPQKEAPVFPGSLSEGMSNCSEKRLKSISCSFGDSDNCRAIQDMVKSGSLWENKMRHFERKNTPLTAWRNDDHL
jgi:hypothetical protein